jgi:hypothetical protein
MWCHLPLLLAGLVLHVSSISAQGTGKRPPAPRKPVAAPPIEPPKVPDTPRVPDTFEELFAYRDTRAEDALDYLRCMQSTVNALGAGELGAVPRAWSITCIRQGKEWRGVFGELTDGGAGMQVHLQYAMRGKGAVVRDAVDTARVSGTARALLRGLSTPLARETANQFVPIALPQKGFVEVWIVPLPGNPTRVVVGGDSLIQMSEDGVRELGHSRATPPIRQFAIEPAGPQYTLESTEDRVPLLSELVIARMALGLVPEVHIRTKEYDSRLTRTSVRWTHTKR